MGACTHPADNVHESAVHTLLSSHFAALGEKTHPDVVQVSSVQGIPSAHAFGPGTQTPIEEHVSPNVHAFPSVHAVPVAGVCTHPWVGSQVSSVQGLLSLQLTAEPPTHWPVEEQVIPEVHAFWSSQAVAVHWHWEAQLPVVAI